jgi:hypothetical protein
MDICEPHRKHLFLYRCIYSALHSDGSYPTVARAFVVAGTCLPVRLLETPTCQMSLSVPYSDTQLNNNIVIFWLATIKRGNCLVREPTAVECKLCVGCDLTRSAEVGGWVCGVAS